MKRLTKGELNIYDKRITQIDEALELCDDNRDRDVMNNLENELNEIISLIQDSIKASKKVEKPTISTNVIDLNHYRKTKNIKYILSNRSKAS